MSARLAGALEGIVSDDALLRGPERERWAVSGAVPDAVVFPATAEETAAVLARASEEGWRVVPAGRGGWLGGGAPVDGVELVLGTRRMDRILQYEAADLTISLEAGVAVGPLGSRLEERNQWLPLDPPGAARGSVGALVATGTAGPLETGFGRPRDHVLGGTLVTGDGRILRLGGQVVKNVAGYDLVRLAVGSGGGLGVLTAATLRLFPRPERDVTVRLQGADRGRLLEAARRIATAPVPLAALELVAPASAVGVPAGAAPSEDGRAGTGPGGNGGALLVRVMGGDAAVESTVARVREALEVPGGSGTAGTDRLDGSASEEVHGALEQIEDGASLVVRLALLPARLAETLERAGELVDRADAAAGPPPVVAAHVSTGVVRVVIRRRMKPAETDEWARALEGLRSALEAAGGSLTISSGPPELVRAVGSRGEASTGVQTLLRGLKDTFDPAGIMAPGRLAV